jgi:hypothetical protein
VTAATQKEIGLTLVNVLLAVILFWSFALAIEMSLLNIALAVGVALLAAAWLVATAITLFAARRWSTVFVIFLGAAAATVSAGGFAWGALGGGLLLFLFGNVAWQALRRDANNMRVFRTGRVFTSATRLLVMGLILALAGQALPRLEEKVADEGLSVSSSQVEFALRPLQPVLQSFIPSLDGASNIDSIIDSQLRQQGVDPAAVGPNEREQMYRQLQQQFKVGITGQESLGEVVAGRLNETLRRLTQTNALTIALVAVVLVFLTLRAFIPAISWLLLPAVAGGIWMARRAGLLVAVKETIEAETLTL